MSKKFMPEKLTNPRIKPMTEPKVGDVGIKPRRLKTTSRKSRKLDRRAHPPIRIISAWKITKKTFATLARHKGLFIGMTIVYIVLSIILVRGLAVGSDFNKLQALLDVSSTKLGDTLLTYTWLLDTSGATQNDAGSVYRAFLLLFMSLAIVYALRQIMAGTKLRLRDPFYRGMFPFVPVVIVLVVIGLQSLPMVIGASFYNVASSNGIAVNGLELVLWGILALGLSAVSLYMVTATIFAIYIAALPDMTPIVAIRSAWSLVRNRRWTIIRKVVFLPIMLLVLAFIILLPFILTVPVVTPWLFYLLSLLALPVFHTYMYTLYRELIHES